MESKNAEENISTEQPPPREEARISSQNGDEKRSRRDQASPSQRPQAINGSPLLGFGLRKETRLRKRAEFLRVYDQGMRFEGRFMTVFILPGKQEIHRVGVTATKKAIGNAVQRNRAKRLLRESFRLSFPDLESIETKYDWVLNARRSILLTKLEKPLAEFRQIVARVAKAQLPQSLQSDQEAG